MAVVSQFYLNCVYSNNNIIEIRFGLLIHKDTGIVVTETWPLFGHRHCCLVIFALVSAPVAHLFFSLKGRLTCNWILEPQALGNYWIRRLMGNTPWDTNNYMKVIPGSSDPAHQTRWQRQKDCCQSYFKENEYWAINMNMWCDLLQ